MKLVAIIFFFFINLTSHSQYLSDIDSTYRKIEDFQLRFGNNHGLGGNENMVFTKELAKSYFLSDAPTKPMENLSGLTKEKLEELFDKLFSGPYPTRYQDPFQYFLLKLKLDEIDKYAKMVYPSLNYQPKYGTFYSNSASAETKAYQNDYLILVHEKFMVFAEEMALTALEPYRKDFEGDSSEETQEDKIKIYTVFLDNFLAFFYENYKREVYLEIGNQFFNKYLVHWTSAVQLFVIAHEYAHAMLKHKTSDENEVSDKTKLLSWYNEIAADKAAAIILNKYLTENKEVKERKGFIKYMALGNLYYFITLYIFENQQSLYETGKVINSGTAGEQEIMIELLTMELPLEEALQKFNKLSPELRDLSHPPTFIRIKLLADKALEIGTATLHDDNEDNKDEDRNAKIGKDFAFGLLDIMSATNGILLEMRNDKSEYDKTYKH